MKLNNIIFPMLAGSLLLVGCYDEKMDWHTPDGHNPVTTDDIPLQLQEQIDHYDYIKNYMAEYMPGTPIGVGLSADKYLDEDDPDYAALCDNNFQQYVTGNAMKMDAMVTSSGALNTTKLDAFLAKAPEDVQIFGHNFIWHTQQQQAYLRSLIAPTQAQFIIGGIATQLLNDSYNFNGGTKGGWNVTGDDRVNMSVEEGGGQDGSDCIKLEVLDPGEAHQVQFYYDLSENLDPNKTYKVSFKVRSSIDGGYIQFQTQNVPSYGSQQWGPENANLGTGWTEYEWVFTPSYADDNRIICNLGKVASTYYIDDIVFGEKLYDDDSHDVLPGSGINYTLKTAKEKRQALLGAMKSWIGGMLQHVSGDQHQRFVGWDVINEPITDDGHYRGIDGHFGGSVEDDNGNKTWDTKPVEDETNGLTLNWGNNHFYWGYYLGMDYAVQAFKLARQYAPAGMKLYVNDYGLESNPNKLAKLIAFVNYIDQNGGQTLVDGIATQMHVTASSITREQVDQMFQTMVATGKLVRVSELDVALETASPTEEDLQLQSDVYKMIIESYKENVPENLRGGFVIWGVSDAADEHVYWIPNDAPNLFDANYERKLAYKGLCDGIAGYDIGSEFTGDMWKEGVTVDDDGTTGDEGTTEGGEGSATEGE